MLDDHTTRLQARLPAADTATVVLAAILVPQTIARSVDLGKESLALYGFGLSGIAALVVVLAALRRIARYAPRREAHEIVATHLSPAVGVIAASARFLANVLIVALSVGLIASGMDTLVPLGNTVRVVLVALILVLALPVLMGRGLDSRVYWAAGGVGALALAAVLAGGLIMETMGEVDAQSVARAAEGASPTGVHPVATGVLGSLFPAALAVLLSERVGARGSNKRVADSWLAKRMVALVVAMTLTLYVAILFSVQGQGLAVPTLTIAAAIFGTAGARVVGVAYIVVGVATALSAYARLPHMLAELGTHGILPRRLGTVDALRPRLLIVAATALGAAAISSVLVATRAGALIFVVAMFVELGLTALAIWVASSMGLKESIDRAQRTEAKTNRLVFGAIAVGAVGVLGLVTYAAPVLLAVASLALFLPAVVMMGLRRRMVRVRESLAASDLTLGRRLPTRIHGVVVVHQLDAPTLRTVSYARGHRLSSLTAVTVDYDAAATRHLRSEWRSARVPVDLTVLGTPEGASRNQIVEFVHGLQTMHPGDVVTVFYTGILTRGGWSSRSVPRLVRDLRYIPGVVLAEVPYMLEEDE